MQCTAQQSQSHRSFATCMCASVYRCVHALECAISCLQTCALMYACVFLCTLAFACMCACSHAHSGYFCVRMRARASHKTSILARACSPCPCPPPSPATIENNAHDDESQKFQELSQKFFSTQNMARILAKGVDDETYDTVNRVHDAAQWTSETLGR